MNSLAVFELIVLTISVFIFTKSAGLTHRIYVKDMFVGGPEVGLKCQPLPLRVITYGKSVSWRVKFRKNKVTVSTCSVFRYLEDDRGYEDYFVAFNSSAPPDAEYIYRRPKKAGGKIYYSITGKGVSRRNTKTGQELYVKSWKRRTV